MDRRAFLRVTGAGMLLAVPAGLIVEGARPRADRDDSASAATNGPPGDTPDAMAAKKLFADATAGATALGTAYLATLPASTRASLKVPAGFVPINGGNPS